MNKKQDHWIIFTDGACSGNPGPGGWGAIVANPHGNVLELGGRAEATTNNKMELTAALEALKKIKDPNHASVMLYTDSTYVIQGITQWIKSWKARGWKKSDGEAVLNEDLWKKLEEVANPTHLKIEWRYVPGHSGFPGNERCDEIAVSFAQDNPIALFKGKREDYSWDLSWLPENSASTKFIPKGEATYLSFLGGILMRHKTWKECEARVKGQKGVRFKKVQSLQEEQNTLRLWNAD